MYRQKLYKNGNSVAVTIPKPILNGLNLEDGSEVMVIEDADSQSIVISRYRKTPKTTITPEFLKWLENFNKRYGSALKELAKK